MSRFDPERPFVVQFRILGPLDIVLDGRPVTIAAPRQRAVLAALLLNANRVLPADRIIALIWGDDPPATAQKTLQTLVHRLRRLIEPGPLLETRFPGYLLRLPPDALDLTRLEALHRAGTQALRAGDPAGAARLLRQAAGLSRGPALVDIATDGRLADELTRIRELQLQVLEDRNEAELRCGNHAELIGEIRTLVVEHPLRERLCGQLMLALYRSGRQSEALTAYRNQRRTLAEELGITPTPELEALHRAVLTADPALAGPAETGGAGPNLLPLDIADFTGRERHLADLLAGVTGGFSLITGKAGIGKTSLAVHAGHRLGERFPDGQLFLHLGATSAEEAMTRALVLSGMDRAAVAQDPTVRAEQYRAELTRRRVLIILDNAADEAQVRPLVPYGSSSAAIVTSRQPLAGLAPTHRLTLSELDEAESASLLATIAGTDRVAAEPEAASRIVELCGRLPLAIRIAGAKLASKTHWTLAELVARLADERRRLDELQVGDLAVRPSLMLSYQELDGAAQTVFRVLGQIDEVDFPAWVPASLAGLPVPELVDVLERLVDRQLIDVVHRDQAGRQRYRLHDLVALFARELLRAAGSAPDRQVARGQALGAWLVIFDAMETRLVGGVRPGPSPIVSSYPLGWLPALRSAVSSGDADAAATVLETGSSITGTLVAMSFELWSQWDDWQMTRASALHAGRRVDDRLVFTDGMVRAESLVFKAGHEDPWDGVVTVLEQALAVFRELGDAGWHAMAMLSLGNVYRAGARFDLAGATLQNCVTLFREIGNPDWEAAALFSHGSLRVVEGDLTAAVEAYRGCLRIFTDRGDRLWQAYTRRALGYAYQQHGWFAEAETELSRALPVFREHGDQMWEAHTLLTLGCARLGLDRLGEASGDLSAAVTLFQGYGDPRSEAVALRYLAHATGDDSQLASALAAFLRLENPVGTALTLRDLELRCRDQGRTAEADRYRELVLQIDREQKMP
jgi:DNA-binding SARP family transcriptional activator/tetratricopeptide (TPR) repeat protein